jgi:hypothetical protein
LRHNAKQDDADKEPETQQASAALSSAVDEFLAGVLVVSSGDSEFSLYSVASVDEDFTHEVDDILCDTIGMKS